MTSQLSQKQLLTIRIFSTFALCINLFTFSFAFYNAYAFVLTKRIKRLHILLFYALILVCLSIKCTIDVYSIIVPNLFQQFEEETNHSSILKVLV